MIPLLRSSLALLAAACSLAAADRQIINFNPDWRFIKDDPANAAAPAHDDRAWAVVSAPHTYNDTDTFDNWSMPGHRGEQVQWSGRTWYRKTFDAPVAWRGKKIFIEFEAVRQIAEVYLNGQKLGTAKGGFTPFGFDLTPHLKIGEANLLAVMADNRFQKDPLDPSIDPRAATTAATHPNLAQLQKKMMQEIPPTLEELQADQIPWNNPHWHPAHGGLYRNIRLIVTDPLHITLPLYSFLQTEGPYIFASDVTGKSARVGVEIPVQNDRATAASIDVQVEVLDQDGHLIGTLTQPATLAAGQGKKITGQLLVSTPRLWEPAYPHLYRARVTVRSSSEVIDTTEIPFGIRSIRWETDSGLFLNGSHLKLQGWGQKSTNEWPGLGAALPDWLQFYTLKLMREAGGNFVRWGHVPGSPAQIVAGDRLGLIALQPGGDGEHDTTGGAWILRVNNFRDVIVYFRNNPSIFIWEGGNQKISREHAAEMRAIMDRYDPHGGRAYAHRRADAITAEFMDVGIGTEGGREIARLPVVEGEYNREESPRRVWDNASPPNFGYPEGKGQTYQLTSEQFAVNQIGHYVKKLGPADHAGGANWIFTDSTSGGRVSSEVCRTSGEVDGVRLPKEAYYVTAAMFRDDPQVHIIGHWSYPEKTKKTIYVASNADEVELFLNGQSLGRGAVSNQYLFTFADIVFAPGEIKAVATRAGQVIATHNLRTVGPAVALRLTALTDRDGLRADGSDIALFDVEAIDARGDRVPTFQQRVDFELTGPAVWRGGYNSGKIDSINNTYLDLEAGINRVAIRAARTPGAITLAVRGEGLKPASLTLTAQPDDGALPTLPELVLLDPPTRTVEPVKAKTKTDASQIMVGKFIKAMNYTGPSGYMVHVEVAAADGRSPYVDRDLPFSKLPEPLRGADWIQIANKDAFYSAVDLIEFEVVPATTVWIAHDNRVPRPAWLEKQFQATEQILDLDGNKMTIYQRAMPTGGSLTFGPNTDDTRVKVGNHYLVFVNTTSTPKK